MIFFVVLNQPRNQRKNNDPQVDRVDTFTVIFALPTGKDSGSVLYHLTTIKRYRRRKVITLIEIIVTGGLFSFIPPPGIPYSKSDAKKNNGCIGVHTPGQNWKQKPKQHNDLCPIAGKGGQAKP